MAIPVCVLTVFLSVVLAYPGGIGAAYDDAQSYRANQATLDGDRAVRDELAARSTVINTRIEIKDGLIEELIAGRTGLVEVAGRFEALNRDFPECQQVLEGRYPGAGPAERAALNVIDFVRAREMSACERAEILARLRAEYRAAYRDQYALAR